MIQKLLILQVVPRQTCRLFTHNYLFEKFVLNKEEPLGVAKRGRAGVVGVAEGGEVFNSLLNNPVRDRTLVSSKSVN